MLQLTLKKPSVKKEDENWFKLSKNEVAITVRRKLFETFLEIID